MRTFTKHGHADSIAFEAAGLRALKEAETDGGGARVATVVQATESLIETEFINVVEPTKEAAWEFGRRLAATHAHCPADERVFGQAPEGVAVGKMGQAPLALVPAGSPSRSWGEFYAEDRILPYIPAALKNGSMPTYGVDVIETLCERLRDGVFDVPQPKMVESEAALLHGDLWSGNLVWSDDGVTLIDPACHGGHAESDLAQLTVFGAPFSQDIYDGYDEVSHLADGWQERIALHRLHMVMVHAAIYGGEYGSAAIITASMYC